ncbi:MAG TPA: WbuC family cupin fold metalloprotein [Steroidobacteraceae bacterium]|nr:WbuC family cupin fold metalloprotein [Steroidobacteraceae bacterium]
MKLFSRALLDELATRAAGSPRQRAHLNIHGSSEDPVQRFFVAAQRSSYFRPHRHLTRSELAVVLRGRFDILTFDDSGRVTARHEVGEGTPTVAYETPQGTWHTLVSTADGGTFLEIKQGPYDPSSAAEFAPWAPAEGHESAARFLEWLRHAQPGASASAA